MEVHIIECVREIVTEIKHNCLISVFALFANKSYRIYLARTDRVIYN